MIVRHGQRFRVAGYHRKINPEHASAELSQGLVLGVRLAFEFWLDEKPLEAEAFLDPGADHTIISRRWISDQAANNAATKPTPRIDPEGILLEQVSLSIGAWSARLGAAGNPVWLFEQDYGPEDTSPLPGYEDILLGRDFLSQHGLLVVVDGKTRTFSILAPNDSENRRRRDRILSLLTSS